MFSAEKKTFGPEQGCSELIKVGEGGEKKNRAHIILSSYCHLKNKRYFTLGSICI